MINYVEYLNLPTQIGVALAIAFLIMQVVGEVLELKGKSVSEIIKIRKWFARRKRERATMHDAIQTLGEVKAAFREFNAHYSSDNIRMRDEWINCVNKKLEQNDAWIKELDKKLDRNNQDTLALLIDHKRNAIIDFAAYVIDETKPVTREQFNRVFKLYKEYEEIIEANGLTNGEADIALRIISESYENHLRNHTFVENIRGYTTIE